MYENILSQIGLTENQASIYEILLKIGPATASKVSLNSPLKRPLTYMVLDELVNLQLVNKTEPGKITIFEPCHPSRLKELAEKKEREIKNSQATLESVLGQMASDFNLATGKPGVRFYEGEEGLKKVAEDSLSATTEIYSYVDNEAVNKYIPKYNQDYVKKRGSLGVKKKMISLDTPYIRGRASSYNRETTDIRLINAKFPFGAVMQIYDNKVSYITLGEKKIIGIIIEDPHVAQMHKSIFEFMWENSKPLFNNPEVKTPAVNS